MTRIVDAYIDELELGEDVYYRLYGEDENTHMEHIGNIFDLYENSERIVIIMYDDSGKMMYSVLEFNRRNDLIASEVFDDYKSAKKFFKEII